MSKLNGPDQSYEQGQEPDIIHTKVQSIEAEVTRNIERAKKMNLRIVVETKGKQLTR